VGIVSIVGGRIAGVITITQVDIKALIAYSRVVHISIITLVILFRGMFSPIGGLIMLIGHGLCRSGLFYLGTINYERYNSRRLITTRSKINYNPRDFNIFTRYRYNLRCAYFDEFKCPSLSNSFI
jgi:NADH:ubiquinone oxidoreductase subunit 4 (subunit M)